MSTPARRLAQIGLLAILAAPIDQLPVWFRASWLGLAWAALFLTGMVAAWARRRVGWIFYASAAVGLAQHSLPSALQCTLHQAWLMICLLLAAGWLVGKVAVTTAYARETWQTDPGQAPQLTIWDLSLVATLVACLCAICPRVEESFHLVCQVAPALIGGTILSLLATQWAWRDHWNVSSMACALGSVLLACGCVLPLSVWTVRPTAAELAVELTAILAWMLSGPLSVIAAQGTLVLAYLGLMRLLRDKIDSSSPGKITLHVN